jgi:SsrA-binding protein
MEAITNKKAYFNYEFLEKFEAGVVLTGAEVKSTRLGRVNLAGSYVVLKGDEVYLLNATIFPFQPQNTPKDYQPTRPRKLLLHKKEIQYLIGKSKQRGLTLIPLRVYSNKGKIKIEFAVARGRKKTDKKELIQKRETQRDIRREFLAKRG